MKFFLLLVSILVVCTNANIHTNVGICNVGNDIGVSADLGIHLISWKKYTPYKITQKIPEGLNISFPLFDTLITNTLGLIYSYQRGENEIGINFNHSVESRKLSGHVFSCGIGITILEQPLFGIYTEYHILLGSLFGIVVGLKEQYSIKSKKFIYPRFKIAFSFFITQAIFNVNVKVRDENGKYKKL